MYTNDYFLIYNPTARCGRSKSEFRKVISFLEENNADFEYVLTSKKNEAIELTRSATKEKYDVDYSGEWGTGDDRKDNKKPLSGKQLGAGMVVLRDAIKEIIKQEK